MYVWRVSAPTTSPSVRDNRDNRDLQRRLRFAHRLNAVLALAVVLLLGMVFGRDLTGGGPVPVQPTATPAPTTTTSPDAGSAAPRVVRRDPADTLAIGALDAPVVLVEWADLRCPYCALFTTSTMPALVEEYVATGKVRLEFNDVSFFGGQSTDAAVALRAAAEQDRFSEYLGAVHAAAPASGHADLPREKLVGLARAAGVPDLALFERDLDRADLRRAVEASTAHAQGLGVTSVPFFVIGDQAIPGAQPLDVFRQALDEALRQAGA